MKLIIEHWKTSNLYLTIGAFATCHLASGWHSINQYLFSLDRLFFLLGFIGFLLTCYGFALLKPRPVTRKRLFAIVILAPYVASIIAFFFAIGAFHWERGGNARPFPLDGLVIALVFPYPVSAAWLISLCSIAWIFLYNYYLSKTSTPTPTTLP